MTPSDMLSEAKQALYEDISAAIEQYQSKTGIEIVNVSYSRSTYSVFPKTHFIGFKCCIDVGNET